MVAKKQTKKNPTNAEIMKALLELERKVEPLASEVANLRQWRHDQETARTAVTEYIKSNPPTGPKNDQWLNRELVKTLGVALAIILALVTLMAQIKGIK